MYLFTNRKSTPLAELPRNRRGIIVIVHAWGFGGIKQYPTG